MWIHQPPGVAVHPKKGFPRMGRSEKGGRTLANLRPPPPLFALSDRQRRHCVPFSYSLFHFLFSFFPLFSSPNTAYCCSSVCVYWKERGEYDGPLQIEKPSRWQRSVTIAHYILLYSFSRQRSPGPFFCLTKFCSGGVEGGGWVAFVAGREIDYANFEPRRPTL